MTKIILGIYTVGLVVFIGGSVWAGQTGLLLPRPSNAPARIKKDAVQDSSRRHHHRYFWYSRGFRHGK